MSVRDIQEYYDKVCNDYIAMQREIKEFEEDAKTGLVNPQALDTLKATIQPIMVNYQTLSWIMYLLNKPVKASKRNKYDKQYLDRSIKAFGTNRDMNGVLVENKETLDKIKEIR